jgi:hypothetical protein
MDSAVNKGHPVNRRSRRVRSQTLGLRAEPWGLNAPLRYISSPTDERPPNAKTCGMWRIRVSPTGALLSRKRRAVGAHEV